jgi:CRP/FNR family cyclic AMP-dependent transcriptional regulator
MTGIELKYVTMAHLELAEDALRWCNHRDRQAPSPNNPSTTAAYDAGITISLPRRSSAFWQSALRAGTGPREDRRCYMEDGFNLTQLVELCGPTELILIRPGEFLFREGDEAQSLYIVKKGSLRIMSGSVVYETVMAGGVVGEMALIEDGAPRSASVLAVNHAELWEIDTDTFRSMVATNPNFALMIMRVMARRLRIMNQRYRPAVSV